MVFDMDNTLFDEFGRESRPGLLDLPARLSEPGHTLILWTSSTRARDERILADHDARKCFAEALYREDYDPDNAGAVQDIRRVDAAMIVDDDLKHIYFAEKLGAIGFRDSTYRGCGASADEPERLKRAIKNGAGWRRRLVT